MNIKVLMRSKVALGALCAALGCATSAQAQTAAETEEAAPGEIVVTALKREQKLQDVPASISAVTGDELSQRGIGNLRDLAVAVPNLVWGEFAGTSLITIRGVGSNIDSGVTEPTVATYVDGLALPRSTMAMMRAVDLERVEVLRGPQGTLYGRNATGGAINFVSARPTKEFAGKIEGSAGSRNAWGVNGFVSGPLADGVYFRASGGREKQDGYVEVLNTGQRLAGVNVTYGRFALLLEPASNVSIDLGVRYEKNTAAVGFQQQLSPSTLLPLGSYTTEPNRFLADGPFSGRKETFVASGGLSWNVSDSLTFKSLTGYIDHRSHDEYECDVSVIQIYNCPDFTRPSKSFSQEFNIIGDYDRLSFIFGAYYFHEKNKVVAGAIFGADAPVYFGAPEGAQILLGYEGNIKNLAFYGDAKYALTDKLRLNLGLRVTREDNKFIQGNAFLPFAPLTEYPLSSKSTRALPKAALLYEFSPDINGYAQYSRGYKSGGSNLGAAGGPVAMYKPEVLDAFEVGLKSQFLDRRVTANFAAFYYKYQDLQIFNFIPPFVSLVENADARLYGVEAEFRLLATDNLTLSVSPTWLHGTFKDFSAVEPLSGLLLNLDGRQLPRAPKFSVNAGIEQRIDLGGTLFSQLQLAANLRYNSTIVLRYYNVSPFERQDPYAMIDLSASVVDADQRTRLSAFVNNLTDKIVRQSSFSNFGYIGVYGPPRTWGVRLSRSF